MIMRDAGPGFFLDWHAAFTAGHEVAGGKGWNLARLARYGFTVPAGGVLTAAAHAAFMEHNRIWQLAGRAVAMADADGLDAPSTGALLERLDAEIRRGSFPAEVEADLRAAGAGKGPLAVRSSATCEDGIGASFAGIHDSFLGVRGIDGVLEAVRGCYASLWTPRALAYRRRMNIGHAGVAMAVVIQDMVPAHASGVAFSCDPATGDGDVIVVNAALGLGEALVSGRIDPDRYELDIISFVPRIRTRSLGGGGRGDAVLRDADAVRLAVLVSCVHESLGDGAQHQDVEWALEAGRFVVLQARPVTGAVKRTYPALADQPETWSNANLRDAMPHVLSTLYWSSMRNIMELFFTAPLRAAGYTPLPGAPRIGLHAGRLYFNLSLLQWESFDAFGIRPASVNLTFGGHQPEISIAPGMPLSLRLARVWRTLRLGLAFWREKRHADALLGEMERRTGEWKDQVHACLSDAELTELAGRMRQDSLPFATRALLLNIGVGFSLGALVRLLEKSLPGRGTALANGVLAGSSGITSAEHGLQLMALAEQARDDADARAWFAATDYDPCQWRERLPAHSPFRRGLGEFLRAYGHRGIYELEVMHPRWGEDPTYLCDNVRALMDTDAAGVRRRQREKAAAAWAEIGSRMGPLRRALVAFAARRAAADARLREAAKSATVRISAASRALCEEMGRRLMARGAIERAEDVYHCARMELLALMSGDWDGSGLKTLVEERKARRAEFERRAAPDLVVDGSPRRAAPAAPVDGSRNTIAGMGVAAGRATGDVRILRHPSEAARLRDGDVLVAPSTDPAWTPLFLRAAAIVMETGGQLSHGAIVAREYGIPAVVNIPGVLDLVREGQRVTVDGDAGLVVFEAPGPAGRPEEPPTVRSRPARHSG